MAFVPRGGQIVGSKVSRHWHALLESKRDHLFGLPARQERRHQPPYRSRRHQIEDDLTRSIAKPSGHRTQQNDLSLAQGLGRLSAVKEPNRNQIERVEPRADARQRAPQRIARLVPRQHADGRGPASAMAARVSRETPIACQRT